MQSLRKIAGLVAITSILLMVVAAVVIRTGDWRAYTVYGGSMEPEYSPGDIIFTSTVDGSSIETGEIIVFTAGWASERYEQRVVHRVTAIGSLQGQPVAFTRGDANVIADPQPVSLGNDVRRVRFSLAAGGFLPGLITNTFAVTLALILLTTGATGAAMFAWMLPVGIGAKPASSVAIPVSSRPGSHPVDARTPGWMG